MKDTMTVALRKLRLSGLAQTLDVRLQEARGNSLSHEEFLELILQDELNIRGERLIRRRTKTAAFREGVKTLEDFNWAFNPSIKKKQIYELASGSLVGELVLPKHDGKWNLECHAMTFSHTALSPASSGRGLPT